MSVRGWTVVFRGERIQADLVGAVLQAEGLHVEVFGDHAYGVGINLTDARVLVPDVEAATALELIRQAEAEKAGEPDV
jgi:hypothetical protein